jgi:hypothetical protein
MNVIRFASENDFSHRIKSLVSRKEQTDTHRNLRICGEFFGSKKHYTGSLCGLWTHEMRKKEKEGGLDLLVAALWGNDY